MAYMQAEGRVAAIRRLSPAAYDMTLFLPEIAEAAAPGQFVHLRCGEKPLRRPISICAIDRANGARRLVFEVRGEGTAWLAARKAGETLDVLGPLGNGFSLPEEREGILLIGGGIGTPPLLGVAQAAPGRASAASPKSTKSRFMAKPSQMTRRARRKPHTSTRQSLMMYDTGKTISPAVSSSGPIETCFVSSRLAAIRHTQKSTVSTRKGRLTL